MGATYAKDTADGNIAHARSISTSSRGRRRRGRRSRMFAQSESNIQRCGTSSVVALSGPDTPSHAREELLPEQEDVLSIPSVSSGITLTAPALENVGTNCSSAYHMKTKPIVTGATAVTSGMGESAVNDTKRGPEECYRQWAPVFREVTAEPESTAMCMNGMSDGPSPPSFRVNDKFAATSSGSTTKTTSTTENYTECPVVGLSAVVSMKRKYSVSFSHTSALFTCISCHEEEHTDAPSLHSHPSALDAPGDAETGSQGKKRSLLPTLISKNVAVQPDGDNNSKTETKQQKEEDEEDDGIAAKKETLIKDEMSGRALIEKEELDVREAFLYSYARERVFPQRLDQEVTPTYAVGVASASQRTSHLGDSRSAKTSSLFTFSSIGEEFLMHAESSLLRPPVVGENFIEENSMWSSVVSSHEKGADETCQGSNSHQKSLQFPRWEGSGLLSPAPPPPPPQNNSTMVVNIMSHDDNDVNPNTHFGEQVRVERLCGERPYYEPGDNERKTQLMGLRADHKEASQVRVLRSPSLVCLRDGYFNAAEMDGNDWKPSFKLSLSAREFREGLIESPSLIHSDLPDSCGAHYQRYGASLHSKSLTSLDTPVLEGTGRAQHKVAPCRRGGLIPPPPSPPPSSLSRRAEDAERESRGSSRHMWQRSYTSPRPERSDGSVSSFGYLYSPRAEPVLSTTCTVVSGAVAGMATTAIPCGVVERKSAKHFCRWCDKPYECREVCAVAGESHAVLRLRRKHEKEVKKRAQGLLRCGRIREAISELKAAGII
ncbi:hypothetical protein TcYC6_0022650 [Trypanosoma cruzi]|nr:hypothetical protein TcYC6_0022650 [Trypanosoma cruzi]